MYINKSNVKLLIKRKLFEQNGNFSLTLVRSTVILPGLSQGLFESIKALNLRLNVHGVCSGSINEMHRIDKLSNAVDSVGGQV